MPLRGLVRRSLIASLIRLRPEPFGAHHARQAAEVTDPLDLRRTPARRLGKRVGGDIDSPPREWKVHWVSPTATVTATTAVVSALTQPSTANYSRTFDLTWASATPEKRKVGGSTPPLTTMRSSRFSEGLVHVWAWLSSHAGPTFCAHLVRAAGRPGLPGSECLAGWFRVCGCCVGLPAVVVAWAGAGVMAGRLRAWRGCCGGVGVFSVAVLWRRGGRFLADGRSRR